MISVSTLSTTNINISALNLCIYRYMKQEREDRYKREDKRSILIAQQSLFNTMSDMDKCTGATSSILEEK